VPKIKHTKTELKAQSDALKRFLRFLPMLQLKKQQLQAEIASINARLDQVEAVVQRERAALESWISLFAEGADLDGLIAVARVRTDTGNIAGVTIPLFRGVDLSARTLDLFESPAWFDEAQSQVGRILTARAEAAVLVQQRVLITAELHTTSQRVNLFEKVKIPECREHIRVIRIFLGDEQTAGVARGKIAKRRSVRTDGEDAA
jgi:V/A-type H+-transporting ATPase subunit D